MYVETLDLGNIRTFANSTISFIHPDTEFSNVGQERCNASGFCRGRSCRTSIFSWVTTPPVSLRYYRPSPWRRWGRLFAMYGFR